MLKSTLTVCLLAAASMTAMAQTESFTTTPSPGTINLDNAPGGIGAVDISKSGIINRECDGYATLSRDGMILRQIPAQNKQLVYCIDGFTKGPDLYAYPHVDFYMSQTNPTTQPGEYTISFPEGYFLFGSSKTPSAACQFNYTVPNAGSSSSSMIQPADGSTVSSLKTFIITFEEGSTVTFTDNTSKTTETDPDTGETVERTTYAVALDNMTGSGLYIPKVSCNGNIVTLTLDQEVTANGRYELTYNAECFTITKDGVSTKNPQGAVFTYYVESAANLPVISPSQTTFEELKPTMYGDKWAYFMLDFNNLPHDDQVRMKLMAAPQLAPVGDDGQPVMSNDNIKFYLAPSGEDQKFVLMNYNLAERVETSVLHPLPGDYYLVIPKGAFQLYSGQNSQMLFPITITAPETENFEVSPKAGKVTELKDFTVTFPGAKEITVAGNTYYKLTNGVAEYAFEPVIDGDKLTFSLFNPITEPGEWTLTSPARGLLVDGAAPMMQTVYTIAEPLPEKIYLVGQPQGWNIDSDAMALDKVEEGVYSAKINIPETSEWILWRFYTKLGDWNANSIGNATDEQNLNITFTDGVFEGGVVEGQNNWGFEMGLWPGGEVEMTVDLNKMTVKYASEVQFKDPEPVEPTLGENIYLVGAPQNWNITSDAMPLAKVEDGVYSATYRIEKDAFMFRFYTVLGAWETNSVGAQVADNPVSIALTEGKYSGEAVFGKGSWNLEGWAGGDVTMTVNFNDMTVLFDTTDAVNDLEAEADAFTVYNLQGVCLMRNAAEADLNQLGAGLYIINGKKVMIRK